MDYNGNTVSVCMSVNTFRSTVRKGTCQSKELLQLFSLQKKKRKSYQHVFVQQLAYYCFSAFQRFALPILRTSNLSTLRWVFTPGKLILPLLKNNGLREFRRFSWKASALNAYNKLYLIWFRLRMAYTGESNFTFPATRHFADIFSLIFFWQPKNYKSYSIVFKHLRKLWKCGCKFAFCRVWRVYAETRYTWIAGPRVALRGKGKK